MFERREQPTWLPGRPSWCDWEPMSLRGWYQTQRRKKNFEFFNFFLLKPNCYECKKWLKERGQTIQIGLPTVGDNYKYKYILQNVSKFITILHQNFAITQTAFLKPSSSTPANRIVYFLHVFVILGWIACMKTGQEQYLFTCTTYLPCHCRFSTSPVIECITVIITDQLWSAQTCLQEQTRSFAKNISEIWTRNLSNWIVAKLYIGWTILH